jgi:hypothetical protein
MLADLAMTGNPMFSLQGTQELAAQLDRPRGLRLAIVTLPGRLEVVVGQPVRWLGLAGWVVALWVFFEQALVPSAVVVLGIVSYVVLGVADLPLLARYVILPGVLLELFAAVLLFGWSGLEEGQARYAWMAASVVPQAALVVSLPTDARRLDLDSRQSAASHHAQRDLERLVTSTAARRAMAACPPVRVHDFRVRPFVWYWAGVAHAAIDRGRVGEERRGAYVTPGSGADPVSAAARTAFFKEPPPPPRSLQAPSGARVAAASRAWRFDLVGCG